MIVSDVTRSAEVVAVKAVAQALKLELGQLLTARVTQLLENGQGMLQLADGAELSFSKGFALMEGEQVRLQVVRTGAEVALRLVASDSGEAAKLAENTERTLLKAPDLFSKLMQLSGEADRPAPPLRSALPPAVQTVPGQPAAAAASSAPAVPVGATVAVPALPTPLVASTPAASAAAAVAPRLPTGEVVVPHATTPGGLPDAGTALLSPRPGVTVAPQTGGPNVRLPENLLLTADGENLGELLRKNLPDLSLDDLMKGDFKALAKLLTGSGSATAPTLGESVHRLRVAAESLKLVQSDKLSREEQQALQEAVREAGGEGALLREAKQSLHRLGDVMAAQDILPKNQPMADGSNFLGYRVFWLPEGGMGEVMWRREKAAKGGGQEGKEGFSVLLSLQLSRLGLVQSRITMGEGYLNISLSAREEESLDALRQGVGELRQGLIQAELPLRTLNLERLNQQEMLEERRQALGLSGNLRMEA